VVSLRVASASVSCFDEFMYSVRLSVVIALAVVAGLLGYAPAAAAPSVQRDKVVAQGLTSPWGLAFLPNGRAWVSERDTALIKEIDPTKPAGRNTRIVGKVPGVVPSGEGGLLGIALSNSGNELYAYYTARNDNRVVRIPISGGKLGTPKVILSGIPKNTYHNGGRILVRPDGGIYVATGDAGEPDLSQRPNNLAGKILLIDRNGKAIGGPRVFSTGHRNVQGLALDSRGRLWASEFGSKDADELNLIQRGKNYGWPLYEGYSTNPNYVSPKMEWSPTSTASPSGIAIAKNNAFVASLRGEVLWQVPLTGVNTSNPKAQTPIAVKLGDLGRLRTIEQAPDGSLWLISSNTDGRGDPSRVDDRIYRLTLGN
jgi:glucose/arabinose dehydrogenase